MDSNTCIDFQRIVVTDTETLDKHSNIMEKLRLVDRLPEGRRTYEELLEKEGLKLEQDDDPRGAEQTCQQFVFQGQCLVLGDSGVGKTSLVKAISGKSFDEMEPRTTGIEQSLVDEKWQNLDTKDLIFGNVNRFFLEISMRLMLYGRDGNVIFQQSRFWKNNSGLALPLLGIIFYCTIIEIITGPSKNHGEILISIIFFIVFHFVSVGETWFVFSSKEDWRLKVSIVMVIPYFVFFMMESVPRILKSLPEWHQWAILLSSIIPLLFVYACLPSSSEKFAMAFLVLLCDTLHQEYFWLESAISTPSQDHLGPGTFTAVQLEKAVIDHKKLKNALNQKWSSLKLKILDFAGDKEYQAYFHMFLRSQAIYVIVFNMAEFAEDSLRDLTAKIKSLHFWLESVRSHVTTSTPILLVGTHRGNMERSTMKRINDNLKRNFFKLFCGELVLNKVDKLVFFPVENSLGQNDSGIQTFQRAIIATAEELKETIGQNIPLSWIQIQDALISMKSDKGAKVCVRFEEFPTVFDNFICTNWTEDTLKYFHEKGFMMYLNKEPKRVLLNPDILIDIIIRLVTKQPEGIPQRSYRCHWNLLQEKGMLTKFLLEFLLESVLSKVESKEDVTAFLEEHDLICPLTYKMAPINGECLAPTYFVPALLPICTDEKTLLWNDRSTDKKFFVFFKKFLPEPLFHRLLSRAHKNSKVDFWHSQPIVYRDAGRFWLDCRQPYRLKLLKDMKMIEVTFTSMQSWKPSDVLCMVFAMVDGVCQQSFPFVKFHCGPACPSLECPGHQDEDDFLVHPAGEPSIKRCHVYNIMPGRQGDKIPFMYCVNHCFEDELIEWIP
ncbi:uncharacterized protein [Pocillopora verrucosa]|uniref:uncharacterized protein isoform X2 n=1 Tax=Pocillopora verrucosa TaxID=203993 RepID=UPI0033419D1D